MSSRWTIVRKGRRKSRRSAEAFDASEPPGVLERIDRRLGGMLQLH